jgi:RNA-directed DNA polymerase
MATELTNIANRAKESPCLRFTSLVHLLNEDFLKGCYLELKKGKAPGIDSMTLEEYGKELEGNIKDLVKRLKAKRYIPQPVRRAYIPKPNGDKRPLGIPTVEDKIVQMGIKKILEAIYEQDFMDVSYGFRPDRSPHDALDELDKAIVTRPINWIVDMDIEKFFDTIDHEWLMEFLKHRIADPNLLRLIGRFLKSGVVEDGRHIQTDTGTPQGGNLSPVLANIYLHYVLDLWFEKRVKKALKGYGKLIRYADDFVACFQSEREARIFGEELRERMAKFGLSISEAKSKIIRFGRYAGQEAGTFDFLGITHYNTRTRSGKYQLGRKTSRKKLRQKLTGMNQWLKSHRSSMPLREWWQILKQKMLGHYRYYGIRGNSRSLLSYEYHVKRLVYKWINRRSQKSSYNWKQFIKWLEHNPLPRPKIYHKPYKSGHTIVGMTKIT